MVDAFSRVLVIFAHPSFEKSRVNYKLKEIFNILKIDLLDLYEVYPYGQISAHEEQKRILNYDMIVFQHPFYWYSCPPLLKEWFDIVLEHGFAFGREAKALHGKAWFHVLTVGGKETSYTKEGINRYGLRNFILPFEQTALLCGMKFFPPFVIHGTHSLEENDLEKYAQEYALWIQKIQKGEYFEDIFLKRYIND